MREAAIKGVTYEQAKADIHLSGDIANLGEAAARIAINDGFAVYTQKQAKAEKAKAKTEQKAEHKKAKPVNGAVRVAEDVKVTSAMKANMPILKRIARSGNVAVVVEKFNGADKYSKGFYTGGVIHLNADRLSEGGFTYTGIHESVHFVKHLNPEGYKAIEKFIENYYKEKGVDIEAEIKATQNLYKQRGQELTPEEAMEEIVCNTLSDIATDADALTAFMGLDGKTQNKFIEALKALARKLKEWAAKFLKGTEYHSIVINDADTLVSLAKKLRAELAKAGQKNNTAQSGVRYYITKDTSGNAVVIIDEDILQGIPKNQWTKTVKNTISLKFRNGIPISGRLIKVNKKSREEFTNSKYTKYLRDNNGNIYQDKLKTANNLDEIILASVNYINEDLKHQRKDSFKEFARGEVLIQVGNNQYKSNVIIGFTSNGEMVLYDIIDFVATNFTIKKESTPDGQESIRSGMLSNNSIPNPDTDVKKNSLANLDKEYITAVESGDTETAQRLVDEAAEAVMQDSKIRDKSGKLVKVYHGSDSADFYEFDKQRRGQTDSSMYGRGYYFAFDSDYSSDFGENIREFYVDIKKPYYIDINAPASKIANFLKSKGVKVDFDYSNMKSHFFAKNFGSQKFTDALIDLGYDGVIVRTDEGDYWEAVAFHRNQMKLADTVTYDESGKVIPLSERFNANKRDVRYSFDEEEMNTDYSDLAKLDDKSLKVYNDRGWAKGLFTDEDLVLLNQRIGEIFHEKSRYVRTTLSDGSVVLDLNNKLLLLSGDLENPVINCVLAINAINEADAEFVREDVKYELQCAKFNKESFAAFLRASQFIYGEKSVRTFDRDDYQYIKGRVDTGDRASLPDNWQNYGYTKGKQIGERVSGKTQGGVSKTVSEVDKKSYSFGEEDLDFGLYVSDDSEVAEKLKDSNVAVGDILELTKGAKVDVFEIGRILNKNLKSFGVTGDITMYEDRIAEILTLAEKQSFIDGGAVVGEFAVTMKDAIKHSDFAVDNFKEEREDIQGRFYVSKV